MTKAPVEKQEVTLPAPLAEWIGANVDSQPDAPDFVVQDIEDWVSYIILGRPVESDQQQWLVDFRERLGLESKGGE